MGILDLPPISKNALTTTFAPLPGNAKNSLTGWYHVDGFGADPTGVTDSTAAINAALTAAGVAGGGTVYLSVAATYTCNAKLTIPSGVTLRGNDWTSVLSFPWVTLSGASGYILNKNLNNTAGDINITLRDFTLQGGWSSGVPFGQPAPGSGSPACGIIMRRCNNLHIEHLKVTNVPGISIAYQGVSGFRIINNFVTNSGRDGITGGPFLEHPLEDGHIDNNTIKYVGDDAIAIHAYPDTVSHNTTVAPTNITISNNVVIGAAQWYGTAGTISTTSGSTALSGISPALSQTDVGKVIYITSAVTNSPQITAVGSDGTTATIASAATATVSNAASVWSNQAGRGIYLHGMTNSTCTGNSVSNTFSNGISVTADTVSGDGPGGVGGWRNNDLTVTGNTVNGGGKYGDISQPRWGIRFTGSDYCTLSENDVYNSGAQGIYVNDVNYSSIVGGAVHNNGSTITHYGIHLDGPSGGGTNLAISVIGIAITANAGGGVYAYYCAGLTLDNLKVYNNGTAGTGTDVNGSGIIIYNNNTMWLSDLRVTDNRAGGSKTQTHGIDFHDSGSFHLNNLYVLANVGNGLYWYSAPATQFKRNVVESGTASKNYDVDLSGAWHFSGLGAPSDTTLPTLAGLTNRAPIGSTYKRTDGAAGSTFYVKSSGTNTSDASGWAAIG